MINYLLLITLLKVVFSYEPCCSTCKFFIPNSIKNELGLCSMFQDKIFINNQEMFVKNLAIHCRSNEKLCGKSGYLYEENDLIKKVENYEDILNLCNSEYVEENDLHP